MVNITYIHRFKKSNPYAKLSAKSQQSWGFPGGAVVENLPANVGDTGSSPGPGRSHMPWCS